MLKLQRRFSILLLTAGLWLVGPAVCGAEPAGWLVGVSRVEITPVGPVWMSGYASRTRPAEGTRLPLWAKAVVLEDSRGRRGAIVTMDLVGIDRGTARRITGALEVSTRLTHSNVVLSTSHTHTGPVVRDNLRTMYGLSAADGARVDQYGEELVGKIVGLVHSAVRALRPGSVTWSRGHETFGVNRRNNPEALVPAWRAAGQLKGPVDYDVPVLRVNDSTQGMVAVVFGYACHATVLDDYLWSGDYPGFAQAAFEAAHPGVTALFVAGCGADVNPLPRRKPELAQAYGERLARAVGAAVDGVQQPLEPVLDVRFAEVNLPFERVPGVEELRRDSTHTNRYEAARASALLARVEKGQAVPSEYPYPISLWHLGNTVSWVALGGEVVVDYAWKLRGAGLTWVSGYCHDVMAYIPSARVWDEGGYEGGGSMVYYGLPSRWERGVEQKILETVTRLR